MGLFFRTTTQYSDPNCFLIMVRPYHIPSEDTPALRTKSTQFSLARMQGMAVSHPKNF